MRMALSKASIVQAALDVLDELGMDGVTVRAVASAWAFRHRPYIGTLKTSKSCSTRWAPRFGGAWAGKSYALRSDIAWRERTNRVRDDHRRALLSHRDGAKAFSGTYLTDVDVLQRQESICCTDDRQDLG